MFFFTNVCFRKESCFKILLLYFGTLLELLQRFCRYGILLAFDNLFLLAYVILLVNL